MAQYGAGPIMEEEPCVGDSVPPAAQLITKWNGGGEAEDSGAPCAEPVLCRRVQALEEELRSCREELCRIQRQLSHSQKLHQTAEGTNQELRRRVEELCKEIHERNQSEKADKEVQTDDSSAWSDYYSYYYSYYENHNASTSANVDANRESQPADVTLEATTDAQEPPKADSSPCAGGEQETDYPQHVAGEEGTSLAESLRATAEAALSQTGFTYDESTGMYYDHSTGFYYDSESQLYYDPSTGIYYYCDVESGRYQFHSRVDLQSFTDSQTKPSKEKRVKKKKREPVSAQEEDRVQNMTENMASLRISAYGYTPSYKGVYFKVEKIPSKKISTPLLIGADVTVVPSESVQFFPHLLMEEKTEITGPMLVNGESDVNGHVSVYIRLPPIGHSQASEEIRESFSCSTDHDRVCSNEREEPSSGNKKLKLSSQVAESSTRDSSSSVEDSEPEEGELTDSEKTSSDEEMSSADSASTHNSDTEDTEEIWPPCIRVIVVRSPALQKGSLFIITAVKSATIGREKDMGHTIRIPEVGVSKFHAEVYFDHDLQNYVLVDQGSQNGTVINGNQILQPKTVCEPYVLHHGDEVKFGETVLSFHVHPGSETCDGCEPGQVRAHLRLNQKEEGSVGPVFSKEEKEELRRRGLKKIREKYGLQGVGYEDNKVLKNPKYKDRASRRRNVVGSEGTFQRDDASASVHVEIDDSNKGRRMLEKMGWKKGEGLGKTGDGMRDPIQLQLHKKQAGLGTHNPTSIEDRQNLSHNKKNWEKARERYAENFQNDNKPKAKKAPSWVKSTQ